jgi:hypothetical protein
VKIVGEDLAVIESQVRGQIIFTEDSGERRIIPARRFPRGMSDEHDADCMEARVALRVGIDVEELRKLDLQSRFLEGLANRGDFHALADLDKPARDRPAGGRIAAQHQYHAPRRNLDQHVGRGPKT